MKISRQTLRTISRQFCALMTLACFLGSDFLHAQDQVPSKTHSSANSAEEATAAATDLPVHRVVLYKSGVGYFEHVGRVRGSQNVNINFTSAQLNDVLSSLTVLDLSGGRIAGVDYTSEAPLARRLASLRVSLGEKPTKSELLDALRGAKLEVREGNGQPITGRLLSVERKTVTGPNENSTTEMDEISLLTDNGEVCSADLNPKATVRILDQDLQTEVGRYLGLIASARDQDVRRMTISTAGSGERNLYVSYISEVPIWKTSYRIVLPTDPSKKPLLQGWAIVDNTVGEDWNNVELSLMAGAPNSFIQPLSQPYYGWRPVVSLPQSVQLMPQTHLATLESSNDKERAAAPPPPRKIAPTDATVGSAVDRQFVENMPMNGRSFQSLVQLAPGVAGGTRAGQFSVGGQRDNANYYTVDGVSANAGLDASVQAARQMVQAAAATEKFDDLFEYKLKEPITIRKNQSALVPILQEHIIADPVSLWSESLKSNRPLRAVWMNNSTSLTLDGGSFSVLDQNTFVGEGLMESIKPGERRLLSFSRDLGMLVDTKMESDQQRVTRVSINHGVMVATSELREKKTYTVRNEDTTARTMVIEHPARPGWQLAKDAPKPDETATGIYRFRFTVESKKTEKFVVNETRPLLANYSIDSLTTDQINLLLQQKAINAEIEKALHPIVDQKRVIFGLDDQIRSLESAKDQIFNDQKRLRENMKALKGSIEEKALLVRYTKQLDEEENQLEKLQKNMQETEAQRAKANVELQRLIANLQLEVAL